MLIALAVALWLGPALATARRGASYGIKLVVLGFVLCLAVLVLSAVASAFTPLATRASWVIETVQIEVTVLGLAWLFLGVLGVGAGAVPHHLRLGARRRT